MPDVWNVAGLLGVEYRQPIHQSSDQSNSDLYNNNNKKKGTQKQPCSEEKGQEQKSRPDYQSSG